MRLRTPIKPIGGRHGWHAPMSGSTPAALLSVSVSPISITRCGISRTKLTTEREARLCIELVEQRLCLFEIGGVEAFGEPAVDRCEQIASFAVAALVAAQPGEARGGAQFVAPCALLAGNREGGAERILGLRWIGVWQASGELAAQAMNFCVPAPLAGGGRLCQCVVQRGEAFLYFSGKCLRLGQQGEK